METIDLGIKFFQGWVPVPTPDPPPGPTPGYVPGVYGGTDATGPDFVNAIWNIAQTADLKFALIVGLILIVCAMAGIFACAVVSNKQLACAAHVSRNGLAFLNYPCFSLPAKIVFVAVGIIAIACIFMGSLSINAHARPKEHFLTITNTNFTSTIFEDGSTSTLDPSSTTMTNTCSDYAYYIASCKVSLTDEAKSAPTLKSATIKISGFEGKTVFQGNPSDDEIPCLDKLILDPFNPKDLELEIEGPFDVTQLENLYNKTLFKITLKVQIGIPLHDNLYEYSLEELDKVSVYLSIYYNENETYLEGDVRKKFRDFRDGGLTTDGSDNGYAMKAEFKNHWAIDQNGHLFGDPNFINNTNTIQARIIGINEDIGQYGNSLGLTFMTTHILNRLCNFHDKRAANFGWSGDSKDGSCLLRADLNNPEESFFPVALKEKVKIAAKGYRYSQIASMGNNIAYDKFWIPSMNELYGNEDPSHTNKWWPAPGTVEGNQYSAFKNIGVTYKNYGTFKRLYRAQNGDNTAAGWTYSRTLWFACEIYACTISSWGTTYPAGAPYMTDLNNIHPQGVIACFCI